jgi:nucleoside-diphosphate-sugar epimerase
MEEPEAGVAASSPYAAAKSAAAGYIRHFHALYDVPVVHLRIHMVYGPGHQDRSKLVPYVITEMLEGRSPRLGSGGRPVDWIYVDDVVDAFLRAAVATGSEGRSLDVGSGGLVSARALVVRLHELVGGDVEPAFGAIADRPLERVRAADPAAAAEAIGWRPRTPLEEGLTRTVAFYRSNLDRLAPP